MGVTMRGFDVVEPGVFRDPRSGKIYTSVSYRTRQFREKYPLFGVDFIELTYPGGNGADERDPRGRFIKMRCEIKDETGRLLAVGHAEEDRRFGPVNKTSAIENAETSALGRALANLGFLSDQYASAEEVEQAKARERALERYEKGDHPEAVLDEHRQAVQQAPPDTTQEVKPEPKPEVSAQGGGDENPYSQVFRDLLVRIGACGDREEVLAIKATIQQSQDDLADNEINELRTQFLAMRARVKKERKE
jgi:hypothetical protein